MSVILTSVVSCDRPADITDDGSGTVEVTVSVAADACVVKSSALGDEEAVRSLQVVLFRDGVLYSTASSASSSLSLLVGLGEYSVYAFVNDPADWISDGTLTEEKILESVSYLADNSLDSFVMFGHRTAEVTRRTTELDVAVDRFVSRVRLKKLSVNFDGNVLHDGSAVTVRAVYLTNVLGSCGYGMTPSAAPSAFDEWYHRMKLESCPAPVSAMTAETGLSVTVADNSGSSLDRTFYCYPNGCLSDPHADAWAPRRTRLVIEASVEGRACYYHVTLPQMLPNHSYELEDCVIRNMGGNSPEENLELSTLSVTMSVTDWSTGFSKELVIE